LIFEINFCVAELSGSEDGEEALDQQNQLLKKIQALLSSNDLIQV
jgi:hypothetical protein